MSSKTSFFLNTKLSFYLFFYKVHLCFLLFFYVHYLFFLSVFLYFFRINMGYIHRTLVACLFIIVYYHHHVLSTPILTNTTTPTTTTFMGIQLIAPMPPRLVFSLPLQRFIPKTWMTIDIYEIEQNNINLMSTPQTHQHRMGYMCDLDCDMKTLYREVMSQNTNK